MILQSAGDNKLQVVKFIVDTFEVGLVEAKDLVDSAPCVLCEDLTQEEAETLADALRELGAEAEIQ